MLAVFRHHIASYHSCCEQFSPRRAHLECSLASDRPSLRRCAINTAEAARALDATAEDEEAAPAVLSALVALSEPEGVAATAPAESTAPQPVTQEGTRFLDQKSLADPPLAPPPRRGRGRPRKTNFQEVKKPPRRSANSALRSLTATSSTSEPEPQSESSLEVGLRAVKSGTPHGEAIRTALFQQGGEAEEERLKKMAMLNVAQQLSRRLEAAIDDLHQQTLHMKDSEREAHLQGLLCEAGGLLNRTRAAVSQFSAEVVPR